MLTFCPQRIYAHTFKIFHDSFGGDRFGVVWDPSLKEPRPFRVLGQFSSVPINKVRPFCDLFRGNRPSTGGFVQENEKTKEKNLVQLNEAAILGEMERLGEGIVKQIVIHARVPA